MAIKLPLGVFGLLLLAIAVSFLPEGHKNCGATLRVAIRNAERRATDCGLSSLRGYPTEWKTEAMLLLSAVAIVGFVTCSGAPQFFRYVLPALPFIYILASKAALLVYHEGREAKEACSTSASRAVVQRTGALAVAACLAWSVGSSLWVYPHSLSYFNEFAGGPFGGHRYLIDSSIDWGQDLLYLKDWLDHRPEAAPLHLAYWGIMDPRLAGIEFSVPPKLTGEHGAGPAWCAVSVNFLCGFVEWWLHDGRGGVEQINQGEYEQFLRLRPVATAGYSIYIYHVNPQEIEGG